MYTGGKLQGISAAHNTGDASKSTKKGVQMGECQLVYITPELLITGSVWRKMVVGELYNERMIAFEKSCIQVASYKGFQLRMLLVMLVRV